jgi:hypothetical protein
VDTLDREGDTVVIKFRQDAKLDPAMLMKLVTSRGDLTLLPPAVLRIDLGRPQAAPVGGRQASPPSGTGRLSPGRVGSGQSGRTGQSWWTTRATADVAPGFTKEEILAEVPADPAAPGGLFERVGAVMGQLSQSLVAR